MKSTAIAYLRVSTDDQGNGLEVQRGSIRAWSVRSKIGIYSWHVDEGVSGAARFDKRPGLMAAFEALGRGSTLVVSRRDRLARDMAAVVMLEREALRVGATISCADGTPEGDSPEAVLMRRMLDSFAEYERGVIRMRTRLAMAAKKARGELVGDVPYGFVSVATERVNRDGKPIKELRPHTREQEACRLAKAHRDAGKSLRAASALLEASGYVSRSGAPFSPNQVRRMVGV